MAAFAFEATTCDFEALLSVFAPKMPQRAQMYDKLHERLATPHLEGREGGAEEDKDDIKKSVCGPRWWTA